MSKLQTKSPSLAVLASAVGAWALCSAHARAATFSDTVADNYGPAYVDVANVVTTNDASNVTFQINLNPSADLLAADGSQIYGKYQIGLQTGSGGSTALMNPYGNPIGISGGMDYWLGGWANNSATPPFGGYNQLYHWNGGSWDLIGGSASSPFVDTPTSLTSTSISFTIPLASLGLSSGSTFKFDVWTTFDNPGGQSAYDALNKPTLTTDPGVPWQGAPYDSGTMLSSYTVASGVTSSSWNVDADGNWSVAGNWSGSVPNAVDAGANFGTVTTAAHTVAVDSPQTVGTINFSSPNSYTVAGASALTLDVSSGQAGINVTAGSHSITAPLMLNKDTTISSTTGTGVSISGNLTAAGRTITKAGAGSVHFANVRATGLNVSAGSAKISAKGTANSASGTSVVNSLTIATGAALDLTNNSMVIDYTGALGTMVGDVRTHMLSNRLITSNADASHRLGYGDNAVLSKTTFGGQTVDTSSVLVKFTYGGDANLDGQVDVTDLGALATSWQTSAPWTGGDFNYDGFVDVSDLGILATDWQLGVGSPLGRGSFDLALASVGLGAVSVPEPVSLLNIVSIALVGLRARRRTGRNPDA